MKLPHAFLQLIKMPVRLSMCFLNVFVFLIFDRMIRPKMGSSINFGTETPEYRSTAHDAMVIKGNGAIDYSAMKEEVVKLKTHLRKHNFTFGEEPVDYTSDYKRGSKILKHSHSSCST